MSARVYFIGFNNQARIDKAVASVRGEYPITLMDNGAEKLTAPDGVDYLKTGPAYFTSAVNKAILSSSMDNEIAIVCNDDIELEPGCLRKLVESVEAGAGMACPIQVDMAVPDRVIMAGTMQAFPAGVHRTCSRETATEAGPRDYPWLPFCVVAFHPAMVTEIGTLDTNMRMWFSDSDYCIRARQAGWRVMLEPSAVVRHEHMGSTGPGRGHTLDMLFVTDQSAFQRKWGGAVLEEYSP